MELSSGFNKALDTVGKHAELIGVGVGLTSFGVQQLFDNINLVATQGHFPDIMQTTTEFFVKDAGKQNISAILAYFLADVLPPKYARPLKTGAKAFLVGAAIRHTIYWSGHSPKGFQPDYRNPNPPNTNVQGRRGANLSVPSPTVQNAGAY